MDAKPEEELLALVAPAAPGLSGKYNGPLKPAAVEFRVARDFAFFRAATKAARARLSVPGTGRRE